MSQNLKLETKGIKHFEAKNYSDSIDSNIEIQSTDVLESEKLKEIIEAQQSEKHIPLIFSEVKKESEVQKIAKNSLSKVLSSRSKLKSRDYKEFRTASGKIRRFSSPTSLFPRSAKSPKLMTSHIQQLSAPEKKSVKDFFNQFEVLENWKTKFLENLRKVTGDNQVKSKDQTICLSCISTALKKVNWAGQDLNLFEQRSTFKPHKINPYNHYSFVAAPNKNKAQLAWGNWDQTSNPYYSFFDSENKWLESVDKIASSWKSYHSYINNGGRRLISLLTMGQAGSGDKEKLERAIDNSKSSLELEIGTKLLNVMSKLN